MAKRQWYFPEPSCANFAADLAQSQYKKMGNDGIKYLLEEYVVLPVDAMKVLHHFQQPDQISIIGIANLRLRPCNML